MPDTPLDLDALDRQLEREIQKVPPSDGYGYQYVNRVGALLLKQARDGLRSLRAQVATLQARWEQFYGSGPAKLTTERSLIVELQETQQEVATLREALPTPEEMEALSRFIDYGATRGNHDFGPTGLLTDCVGLPLVWARRVRAALASPEGTPQEKKE